MRATATLLLVGALLACSTSAPKRTRRAPPRRPPAPTPAAVEETVLREATTTAANELQCPVAEVSSVCTRRDVHGGCVAIQARGCGKIVDYDFGND
jgi:hypothetical protein